MPLHPILCLSTHWTNRIKYPGFTVNLQKVLWHNCHQNCGVFTIYSLSPVITPNPFELYSCQEMGPQMYPDHTFFKAVPISATCHKLKDHEGFTCMNQLHADQVLLSLQLRSGRHNMCKWHMFFLGCNNLSRHNYPTSCSCGDVGRQAHVCSMA